jgi:3-oxoacyl-[acyl-carrier-protein] synthase-3
MTRRAEGASWSSAPVDAACRSDKGIAMANAYISGTGFYVPPRVLTNDDLAREYGIDTTHEWIVQRTGIEARRFADEGIGTSDLAVKACEEAITRAGIRKQDLDMILFATLSPEHHFPGSGVYLQRKLGLLDGDAPRFVPAMDIRNQCTGFLYGLGTAASMVQSGAARHVLLVGAETHSAAIDLSTRGRQVSTLFGDGAGAVVVSATDEDRGVRTWHLGADGRFAEKLCMKVWDIKRRPYLPVNEQDAGQVPLDMLWPYMEGKVVFRHAVERMCGALLQACWALNLEARDIDLFFFHQANKRINEYVANTMNIPPERVLSNIERYGNTTAATIPILLAEAERDGVLRRGMKVAMVAFGSGFTWGSAIVDW